MDIGVLLFEKRREEKRREEKRREDKRREEKRREENRTRRGVLFFCSAVQKRRAFFSCSAVFFCFFSLKNSENRTRRQQKGTKQEDNRREQNRTRKEENRTRR